MATPADYYLTVEEAAEVLRVHPETVRVMLREKRLKGRKLGKDWRIPRSEVMPEEAAVPEQTDP